jgi:hypothetical protein
MRRQFTLRALFGWTTLACGAAAGIALLQNPYGMIPLAVIAVAILALWPWMFGKGL